MPEAVHKWDLLCWLPYLVHGASCRTCPAPEGAVAPSSDYPPLPAELPPPGHCAAGDATMMMMI